MKNPNKNNVPLLILGLFGSMALVALLGYYNRPNQQRPPDAWTSSSTLRKAGSFSIDYTTFNDRPVSLEFDATTGCVALKTKPDPGAVFGVPDDTLEFLKGEVLRLTSVAGEVPLSDGYTLKFTGGYPTWAPHFVNHKVGVYRYLRFAEGATVTPDKVIVVRGLIDKPTGYYPYLAEN